MNRDMLYDETEETKTRYVGFIGEHKRYDLALTQTDRFYGKTLVIDIQSGRSAIIGPDDLEEEGYLAHAFNLTEDEAVELHRFLSEIIF
ncbi:hypothetical protein CathTA2_1455 [Caldalkalibacillus thermarum TA2.A1]|uniref:DUF3055 domain-containing protein n=1 Tax=Caldalkalibacillus thermarum (strain TA2.A1) TaxID=986075 RepID=F5L6K5_CALTT|nr:DUF3055 domain-containing protein [Caldalkalibacillus thermarum]EGL83012.1 hypothetical protein CathTA2_1455 [Caldalkalibacillus thermarum TA2.A1]QZT33739.1 DUF3055 domain-containing protein [Caldalkalibacillus thermarum TA2.A1]GGK21881.1 hypothetical protein GCM10010965_13560 [Caldalkalibacillus thermarum]